MKILVPLLAVLGLLLGTSARAAGDGEEHHPHHLAVAFGAARYDNNFSEFLGLDYVNYRPDGWGVGGFYEEVHGDFDLQVWGILFSKKFGHGFKFNFGPGIERKIKKDKLLAIARFQLGYDWHFGHWSIGPIATVDLIESGNTTWYVGAAVGYGW